MATFLDWALWYHKDGICVVPVKPMDKAVALSTWDEYHTRQSTIEELRQWWRQMPAANIGLVHGVNNFVSLDFDHDNGIFDKMRQDVPELFAGRIEQSGGGSGYHIPLFVSRLPDLGYDNAKDRPKGNKTWKCQNGQYLGDVNIRARWCQTVAPPSIHPSGNKYHFIQKGDIVKLESLDGIIRWLNKYDERQARIVKKVHRTQHAAGDSTNIKTYFPSVLDVFDRLGLPGQRTNEPAGGIRIHDNGGLVIHQDDTRWYNFSDETGGDVVDAVGWFLFRSSWDRYDKQMFIKVMQKMKEMAGIGEERTELPRAIKASGRLTPAGIGRYWG